MVTVWVVVVVLGAGAVAAAFATRRHPGDIEPTVREFAEFRDAISRQVDGLHAETSGARRHLDRGTGEREAGV